MAEIRRLDSESILQLYKIHTIVYNLRKDYSKEENQKADPLDHPAEWAWGAFDGKKLLAGMFELEYLMRFDGHSVKMSGISGVGTLLEARNEGHVRKILEKLLVENHEKGVIFSNLTPFDHDFYRKFGYETACARTHISINTGDMSDIESNGKFVHILPGDDTSLLAQIHSAYISNINHGIHRDSWPDNRAWKRFTREDPCTSGYFVYLWKDENDEARSYIKYQDVTEDGDHNISVTELAFKDMKGLYGALSIAGTLSPQFENFKWLAPTFIDPFDIIGDAWSVETEIRPRDMTRVINVKAALELMRRPEGKGHYVIEVEDENIDANNGKFLVEFEANEVKVTPTKKNPCLSCDILTLSQLVTGYRSLENAMYSRKEGLEVHGNENLLKRVFTQRPQHVTEYF
ncbi:MAG: GNAT family N-acetyltransferase [Treponema sp.]|nr:GNAT family N-acetyltransferase [Treponema sp.]MCL2237345.1 GNAT family N-acetyltransferase [Treponema sp.]